MKNLFCIILWLLFACVDLFAQPWSDVTLSQPEVAAAAGGSCSTSQTNRSTATYDTVLIGFFSANTNATFMIPSSSYTVCKVGFTLSRTGNPSFNLNAFIFSDNSGAPGTQLAVSDTVAASTVGASEGEIAFTFGTPQAITSGTKYWFGIKASAAGDGSNNISWQTIDGFVATAVMVYSGSWSEVNNRLGKINVYSN